MNELKNCGNTVHTIDISNQPAKDALTDISELPDGIQAAVIGVTKNQPADVVEALALKGIKNIWIHWMTETPEALEQCSKHHMECLTNRCPMMYLGGSISIHAVHRNIAKLVGKY